MEPEVTPVVEVIGDVEEPDTSSDEEEETPICDTDLVWQLDYSQRQMDDILGECEALKNAMMAGMAAIQGIDRGAAGQSLSTADEGRRQTILTTIVDNQALFDILFPTCQQLQATIAGYLQQLESRTEE